LLFYLAAYGIMNAGAFGVLLLLPSRSGRPATSAETFDDLAGQGRRHVGLGLAMAVCCLSLIGLPLTVGFIGKLMLIRAAFSGGMVALALFTVINAVISAGYYLRIVATLFLRPEPQDAPAPTESRPAVPILIAVVLSVAGTLFFGIALPGTQALVAAAQTSAVLEPTSPMPTGPGTAAIPAEPQAKR